MNKVHLTGLSVSLPTAFRLKVNGFVENLSDLRHLRAHVDVGAQTYNLDFVTSFLSKDLPRTVRIPSGTNLKGIFDLSTDTTQIELINDDKTSGQRTVKINHKKLATPINTTEQAQSMSALSDTKIDEGQTDILADQVVVDNAGHVTKVTRNKYHVINSHNHLKSNAYDITASTDKTSATIANTITATDENVNGDFVIKSSNLTIGATTVGNSKAVSIDLNWGSF